MFVNLSLLSILLYFIGLILLVAEALTPGLGVAGIGGTVCIIISVAMITSSLYHALLVIAVTIAILILIVIGLYKLGFTKRIIGKLVLKSEQKNDEGYSSSINYKSYMGKQGVVLASLRPAGTILIEDEKLDAVSEGNFIDKHALVEVIEVEGRRIVVRELIINK